MDKPRAELNASERNEVDDEPGAFADAEPCVVQEEGEQVIAAAEGCSDVDGGEDLPDLGFG